MRLGFVSAILPELSFEEVLGFAAAERFACIEPMCWPSGKAERRFAGVTHIDVTDFTQARADDTLAACERHGVALSGLGYYPNTLDPDPAVAKAAIAHLRRMIEAAPLLGLDCVNTFVGRDWHLTVDDNWPRFLDTWRPLVRLAEDHGVRIAIENCPMLFTKDEWPGGKNLLTTPAVWRRAFADIESPAFGLNYDPSHFVLQGMDPLAPLEEFHERIFHVHAKDVRIDERAIQDVGRFDFPNRWHQPRIPGFGEIDWGRFVGELMRTGYDGPVCIEVEDDSFGRSLDGRKRALSTARDVLSPFFPGP
ncbi:MAG: sugar phosphate isomerase/epimerase family protein [Planctomycetia bacterium]